jgi:hypothetical protein
MIFDKNPKWVAQGSAYGQRKVSLTMNRRLPMQGSPVVASFQSKAISDIGYRIRAI